MEPSRIGSRGKEEDNDLAVCMLRHSLSDPPDYLPSVGGIAEYSLRPWLGQHILLVVRRRHVRQRAEFVFQRLPQSLWSLPVGTLGEEMDREILRHDYLTPILFLWTPVRR